MLCRSWKKAPFNQFGWTACWSAKICMKALLLQRTSLQGEIGLPLKSTKLKSESRLVGQGGRLSHVFTFSGSNFVELFDAGGQLHNTVCSSSFHAWYLLYDCEPVLEVEAGFAKSPPKEIAVHKQFVQKETGHHYASLVRSCKADISYDHCTKVVPQWPTSFTLNVNLGSMEQFWNATDLFS